MKTTIARSLSVLLTVGTGWSCAPPDPSAEVSANTMELQVQLPGNTIPQFVDPVPVFGPDARVRGKKLRMTMRETKQQVLPSMFNKTTVWGYEISDGVQVRGPLWPAFTIEAKRNEPTTVHYVNDLDLENESPPRLQKILKVDQTLLWADPLGCSKKMYSNCQFEPYRGPQPAAAHLHGGEVPSAFDGGPDSWFTPGEKHRGPSFVTSTFVYPNGQEPATLFFHDHTLGETRLNLYAGLAGFYFLRGDGDTGEVDNPLRLPAGNQEIELAIQDRNFDQKGQLFFPSNGVNPTVHPFWRPEFFGDVIVVNGKTWPFLKVEPRRYRFRIVNGSNARFYELRLVNRTAATSVPPIWQIGTDGGLLDKPVSSQPLLISPGERADLIIDFTNFNHQTLELVNSANAPFPDGTPPDPATTARVMQFQVNLPLSTKDQTFDPSQPNARLRGGPKQQDPIVRLADGQGGLAPDVKVDRVRQLTLNEIQGAGGPLQVLLNNTGFRGQTTEAPRVGSTERWEIINLTGDTHPIHLHLVQYQLVNRQKFDSAGYTSIYDAAFRGGSFLPGAGPPLPYSPGPGHQAFGGNPDISPFLIPSTATPPNPNEAGWKDTIQMNPGEVTRIVVRFSPQDVKVNQVRAGKNKFPFDPTTPMGETDKQGFPGGPGYVWHCHIVDHEDNEMMRPYIVKE